MTTNDNTNGETATIVLTRDELQMFLHLLGVKALNGQTQVNNAVVSAEEEAIRRNCGEHTLQARGLLTFEDDRHVVLDDGLVALAGTAALPQGTYMLQRVSPDGSRATHYFSRGPDLLVEHTSPKAGIFAFRQIKDVAALQQRIEELATELTECTGAVSQSTEQAKPENVANFLSQFAAGNYAAAEAELVGGGCSPRLVGDMVRSLKSYPHWLAVAGWADVNTQSVASTTVMVIRGAHCCWMLESDSNPNGNVSIHTLDGEASRRQLAAMAQPLQSK